MDTQYYILNIEDPDDTSVLEKGMYVYILLRGELRFYGRICFINKRKFHVINEGKVKKYKYSTVRPGTQIIIPNIPENMQILKNQEFNDKMKLIKEKFKDYL